MEETSMVTPQTIYWHESDSPIGRLLLAANEHALVRVNFQSGPHALRPAAEWRRAAAPLREAFRQLEAYFAGERRTFELPLAPHGTAFQLRVWHELQLIPYGETRSYGELARRLGLPGGARAVGLANGSNPLAIIVPCHRVIGSDGSLTGFGGGLPIKRQLLALEGAACVADLFNEAPPGRPRAAGLGGRPQL
jgi:methylated-DNA-[protein]-cysteine S-methyltransferase